MAQQTGKPSVNDAAAIFSGKLARPNRFDVVFSFPSFGFPEQVQKAIESIEFPALALGTVDFQSNTKPLYKVPYAKMPAQTCNITFRVDEFFNPIDYLYAYVNYAAKFTGEEYYIEYASNLWGNITINAYNVANYGSFRMVLGKALLTNIDTAQLSYDDRDTYLKQTATFAYQEVDIQVGPTLK